MAAAVICGECGMDVELHDWWCSDEPRNRARDDAERERRRAYTLATWRAVPTG